MGGSGLLTFAMIVMMGGGMVVAGWGLVRHHRRREACSGFVRGEPWYPKTL